VCVCVCVCVQEAQLAGGLQRVTVMLLVCINPASQDLMLLPVRHPTHTIFYRTQPHAGLPQPRYQKVLLKFVGTFPKEKICIYFRYLGPQDFLNKNGTEDKCLGFKTLHTKPVCAKTLPFGKFLNTKHKCHPTDTSCGRWSAGIRLKK